MSDPFLWYSGPNPVASEEKPEEASGEPQRVVEWQADNVISTFDQALSCDTFWGLLIVIFWEHSFGCTGLCWPLFLGNVNLITFCINTNSMFWECQYEFAHSDIMILSYVVTVLYE